MANQGNGRQTGTSGNGSTPPPPPSLADAIAAIINSGEETSRLLNMIAQNTATRTHRATGPGSVSYPDFLQTDPPIFKKADHPLEADEWLNVIEQKFRVYPDLTGTQKVEFAGLQLHGPAGVWW